MTAPLGSPTPLGLPPSPQPHQLPRPGPARGTGGGAAGGGHGGDTRLGRAGVRPGAARCQSAHQERHFWCRGSAAAGGRDSTRRPQLTPATRPRWRYRHLGALRGSSRMHSSLLSPAALSSLHCHYRSLYLGQPSLLGPGHQPHSLQDYDSWRCEVSSNYLFSCLCLSVSVSPGSVTMPPSLRLCQRGDSLGIIITLIMSGRELWSLLDKWCHCNYAATGPRSVWLSRNLSRPGLNIQQ